MQSFYARDECNRVSLVNPWPASLGATVQPVRVQPGEGLDHEVLLQHGPGGGSLNRIKYVGSQKQVQ